MLIRPVRRAPVQAQKNRPRGGMRGRFLCSRRLWEGIAAGTPHDGHQNAGSSTAGSVPRRRRLAVTLWPRLRPLDRDELPTDRIKEGDRHGAWPLWISELHALIVNERLTGRYRV